VPVSGTVDLGEVEIAYDEIGDGSAAVVFVHGLGASAYGWRAQLAGGAERGYRTIAYDARGAGRSSKPPGPYSIETWADDLIGLCDRLGLERLALVGHSVGTMVAEHAALRLGERVGALALLGGSLEWPGATRAALEERARLARAGRMDEIAEAVASGGLTEDYRREVPAVHGLLAGMIAANDPACYAEAAFAAAGGSMLEPGHLACPALAFAGEHDVVGPPSEAEAIAAAIPACELATVPGAAHWCQIEAPERVNEVLFGFLEHAHAAS
jgi:3-oxoadipate enol-lactonase